MQNSAVVVGIFILLMVLTLGMAFGAELEHNGMPFGWQDREYFGCKGEVCTIQLGGGDAAAGESGDAGAAASSGDSGASSSSGDSGGDGCGR